MALVDHQAQPALPAENLDDPDLVSPQVVFQRFPLFAEFAELPDQVAPDRHGQRLMLPMQTVKTDTLDGSAVDPVKDQPTPGALLAEPDRVEVVADRGGVVAVQARRRSFRPQRSGELPKRRHAGVHSKVGIVFHRHTARHVQRGPGFGHEGVVLTAERPKRVGPGSLSGPQARRQSTFTAGRKKQTSLC